jgi:acyl carrier protein
MTIDTMSNTKKSANGILDSLSVRKSAIPAFPPTEEAIRAWLTERIAVHLKIAVEEIDVRETFSSYGLDSPTAVGLSGELERWLGRPLLATLVWDYPTIELVAKHLAEGGGGSLSEQVAEGS